MCARSVSPVYSGRRSTHFGACGRISRKPQMVKNKVIRQRELFAYIDHLQLSSARIALNLILAIRVRASPSAVGMCYVAYKHVVRTVRRVFDSSGKVVARTTSANEHHISSHFSEASSCSSFAFAFSIITRREFEALSLVHRVTSSAFRAAVFVPSHAWPLCLETISKWSSRPSSLCTWSSRDSNRHCDTIMHRFQLSLSLLIVNTAVVGIR